jgi:iron complex outermembrane recepter protein
MRIRTFALSTASFAALAFASPAFAQDQQQAPVDPTVEAQTTPSDDAGTPEADPAAAGGEEIIVTGLRRSLQSAQNIRRNSEQIVDAIVAEDIGKLPDLNTAQTAARIPGVQVYRQGGEAQNVLVRGLPNFTTTYNGREIFTAETRVVALQDFPSSNIAALEVFKTSSAELVEPGLAGLVNVRSRRPFDFRGGQIAGSIWGLYTTQAKETTPNFNLLATQRFDTGIGEIGILVNVSRTELEYLDSEPSNTDFIADPVINGQRVRFPDIQRLFYRSGNRVRPSANIAAQWRASDSVQIYAEGLYQGFRNKIDDRLVAVPLYNGGSYTNIVFRPGTNLIESGTVTGLGDPIFTFQGGTYNKTDTYQYAVGGIYDSGPLRVALDLARTKSTFRGSTESVDRIFRNQGTTAVDFDLTTPQFNIRNFDVANPANYAFDGLYEENQKSAGDDYQARIDAEYEFGGDVLRSVEFGLRGTDRDAIREFANRFAGFRGRNIPITALPLDFRLSEPGFAGTDVQSGFRSWLAPTYASIRENMTELRQFVIRNGATNFTIGDVPRNRLYTAAEKTYAGYAQVNLGNDDLGGTVGIRALRVKTRVRGPVPTGIAAIDEGSRNTEYLPSASFKARVMPELQIRAAASKTITRPNFADLVPSITLGAPPPGGRGTDSAPYQAFGGNPFLEPFSSWNFDVAAEYYFGRTSFVSVTPFRRNVDGFIQQSTYRFNDPTLGVVQVTGPVNTGKGRITGVELQGQAFADFDFLPDWARGFGVQGNLTYIKARTQQPNGTSTNGIPNLDYFPITDQLNGVSKWNYNLVGIYERYGFSARLSYNGRTNYAATRQYRGDDIYLETAMPADRLDLSLNYNVTDRFTLFGDWTNITRSPFKQEFSSARAGAPRAEYIRYRRYDEGTVSLGLRFRIGD